MKRIQIKNFLVDKNRGKEVEDVQLQGRRRRTYAPSVADKWKTFRRILKFQRVLKGLSEEYSK